MKVLILGGTGFIGSHVVQECLNRGFDVTIFDRSLHTPLNTLDLNKVKFVLGDIRDKNSVNEAVYNCDRAINLSGILGTAETVDNPFPAVETNLLGGLNFLQACREHKKRAVQITVGNYFMLSTYPISKRALENFALMFNKEHGTQIAVVRGFSVYGEGQKHKPVRKIAPNFICSALRGEPIKIFGSGESIQDQIYVKDVARILVEALVSPNTKFDKIYDAGTGVRTTVNQIAELVNKLTDNKAGIEHIPMRKGEEDNSVILGKIETLSELNLGELTQIEEGYAKTIDWYRKNYNWRED